MFSDDIPLLPCQDWEDENHHLPLPPLLHPRLQPPLGLPHSHRHLKVQLTKVPICEIQPNCVLFSFLLLIFHICMFQRIQGGGGEV